MVHALHDSIDHIYQFTLIVKLTQLIDVFAIMIVLKRMLNVTADCSIDIFSRAFLVTE